jgi:hypothetical protein
MGINLWTKKKEKLREKTEAKVVLIAIVIQKRQYKDLYISKAPAEEISGNVLRLEGSFPSRRYK